MTAIDIIKKFLAYAEYDPEQRTFLWGTTNQQLNSKCKNIAKINAYDPSGAFAVLYAKQCFVNWLKACSVSVFDAVAHPEEFQSEVDLWRVFSSPEVGTFEASILSSFELLLDQVADRKLLGARDKETEKTALLESIEAVVEELPKCNVDLFLRGGEIQPTTNFSTYIHVFERLSECLLGLEQAEDGIYICYVENYHGSLDGYFGFYIKSNGNIISINERIDEAYPGQHKGQRNNRWTEAKKSLLFPYNFVTSAIDPSADDPAAEAKRDYKGYACNLFINEDKLSFLKLEPKAYMPLIVAMLMLNSRYAGRSTEQMRIRYVDSLLRVNLEAPKIGVAELMIPTGSAVATINREYSVTMTSDGIRTGAYAERLCYSSSDSARNYSEYGSFPTQPNIFADLYGDGFELDTTSLLEANPHLKRLTSSELEAPSGEVPNPEYVGSEYRMEILAYMRGRQQLAKYIREKMYEEYTRFGGVAAIRAWYEEAVLANRDKVIALCIERSKRPAGWNYSKEHKDAVTIWWQKDKVRPESHDINFGIHTFFNEYLDERNHDKGLRCCVTGQKASIFFVFDFDDWTQIASIVGEANIPKILIGYRKDGHHGVGNSILDATDPVFEIGTPFERNESEVNRRYWPAWKWKSYEQNMSFFHNTKVDVPPNLPMQDSFTSFKFAIGFSKRGWARILKEYDKK